jgi:serine/threonine-protein kinase
VNEGQAVHAGAASRRWSFANAVVDERTLELRVNGQLVEIERKPLEALMYLLAHPDEVITKDRLLAAVWPGRVLTDAAINKAIFRVREALGDQQQAIVKTLHGVGFRFVATVTVEAGAPAVAGLTALAVEGQLSAGGRRAAGRSRRFMLAAAGAAVAAIAAGALWLDREGPLLADAKSVAVLPFANLGDSPADAWFADGLHDGLITHLARIRDLRVTSRTSVMPYRKEGQNLRNVARELGVANIVEGSVQRMGDRIRVRAQLIDVRTDAHVWAAEYDRAASDAFAVQAELAFKIVGTVEARLLPDERSRIERIPTQSMEAYDLYLGALKLDRETFGAAQAARLEAIGKLERAIALDPHFALAHALLARQHFFLYAQGLDFTEKRLALLRDAAEKAVQLDPDLAESHMAAATYLRAARPRDPAHIAEMEEARRLAPGSALILEQLALSYDGAGRGAEAAALLEAATQLDPRNQSLLLRYSNVLTELRRYADADRAITRAAAVSSSPLRIRMRRALNTAYWKGELGLLDEMLFRFMPVPCNSVALKYDYYMARRRFNDAAAALLACAERETPVFMEERFPREAWIAEAYWFAGDAAQARAYHARARPILEASLKRNPDQEIKRNFLAIALARSGDKSAASAELDRYLADYTSGLDVYRAARVHLMLGEQERAFDELEFALNAPFQGVHTHHARLDPVWEPVWDHPRYRKLIEEHLPKD